jgi:hypothetical protein
MKVMRSVWTKKDVRGERVRTRKTKDRKALPKIPETLPGAVCAQWVKCGKPGCKCARGELHGPYYYRFWREGGRLRKAYVKREDLEATRAACDRRRELERKEREEQRWATEVLRGYRDLLRDLERRYGR